MDLALVAFYVGGVLWLGPVLGFGFWMTRAQRRYIDRYRAIRGADRVPAPDDPWSVLDDPFVGKRWWDIVWEEQSDSELEQARQEVVCRFRICVGYVFGGVLIPFLLSAIVGS